MLSQIGGCVCTIHIVSEDNKGLIVRHHVYNSILKRKGFHVCYINYCCLWYDCMHPNATHTFSSSNSQRCHATANCTLRAENVVLCAAICIGETCKCSYCSGLGTSINFKIKQWSNWIYANHTETHVGSFLPSQQSIFIPVCTFYQRAFFCSSLYNGITEGGRLEQHTVVRRTQNAPGHKAVRRGAPGYW